MNTAPRRPRISLAVNSSALSAVGIEQTWTWLLTVPCEDMPYALRVGFANHTDKPYRIEGVCACPSARYGDYVNPVGSAEWVHLTFAHGGADSDVPVIGAAPRSAVVPGNGGADASTGATNVPVWFWTDFTPVASVPRSDMPDAPRVMMLRVLTPAQTTIVAGIGDGWQGVPSTHQGRDIGIRAHGGDAVSNPGARIETGASNSTPICCVQYLSRCPGITVVSGGDSQFAGDTSAGNVNTFVTRACFALSTPSLPISPWNAAWGGRTSDTFWPCLLQAIRYAQPSVVVIQGWTFNDSPADRQAANRYLARVLTTCQRVLVQGGVPIVATPFPRNDSLSGERLETWQRLRTELLAAGRAGAVVFDATSVLQDEARPGRFRPALTTDGSHPNDAGHAALAAAFLPVLRQVADL